MARSSLRLLVALVLGSLGPAWAATPDAGAQADDRQTELDLRIAVDRFEVLVSRATEGLGLTLPPLLEDRPESGLAQLWRTLRSTARDGLVLQALACQKQLVRRATCAAFQPPAWVGATPTPTPSLDQLLHAQEALEALLTPYLEAGCRAGQQRTKDPLFCSVE